MDELNITPAYLHMLILKARAVMVKEGLVTPDTGGNPIDDQRPDILQDAPDDLTREELIEELQGLDTDQQAELVALMWLGRGDAEPEEWKNVVELAVERLYRELSAQDHSRILTLVQNVADPSPNWGWRNRERTDLSSRAKPELLLCLALIHHVVITANVPLEEFVGWLSDLSDQLVIEYVSRSDDKVEALLRNKEDKHSDYSRENLERELGRHFTIRRRLELESGNRFLYWCARDEAPA